MRDVTADNYCGIITLFLWKAWFCQVAVISRSNRVLAVEDTAASGHPGPSPDFFLRGGRRGGEGPLTPLLTLPLLRHCTMLFHNESLHAHRNPYTATPPHRSPLRCYAIVSQPLANAHYSCQLNCPLITACAACLSCSLYAELSSLS